MRALSPRIAARLSLIAFILVPFATVAGQRTASSSGKTPATATRDTVVFAGGCFWSMQKAFDHVPGVLGTTAGYSGGRTARPSYEEVETGRTGHAESVRVVYDPSAISYASLVSAYLHRIDPTDGGGTFCDRGSQYRPIIFVRDSAERQIAAASLAAMTKRFSKPIAVTIASSAPFYAAEEYHQEYYKKNPMQYEAYRIGCGRDRALEAVWGKQNE